MIRRREGMPGGILKHKDAGTTDRQQPSDAGKVRSAAGWGATGKRRGLAG